MRPLPNAAGGGGGACGPRRRPENLHLVGPLGEPMFVGSPTTCGGNGGLGGGEGNPGMETVSRVLISNCKIGAVIGKGGAIIKHIREVRPEGGHDVYTSFILAISPLFDCLGSKVFAWA